MHEYNTPLIAINYCKNTTENGNWCKSKDEIDNFLRSTPDFFVHMVTYVDNGIFADDPVVDKFPYNGNKQEYFPTVSTYASIGYG